MSNPKCPENQQFMSSPPFSDQSYCFELLLAQYFCLVPNLFLSADTQDLISINDPLKLRALSLQSPTSQHHMSSSGTGRFIIVLPVFPTNLPVSCMLWEPRQRFLLGASYASCNAILSKTFGIWRVQAF